MEGKWVIKESAPVTRPCIRNMTYSSVVDTKTHIATVNRFVNRFVGLLFNSATRHDASKLVNPERESFDKYTPLLKGLTYGSDEYKQTLVEMCPAIQHHYSCNRHHPEHFENGIDGMNLIDLVEMFMDWKAATLRHDNGDIRRSLEINIQRFKLSEQLYNILLNTVEVMEL